jgi:dTDP-4-dehydrorhamnose 3,5-epimerase
VKAHTTPLPGLLRIETDVFRDERGCFFEIYREPRYREAGVNAAWAQDNVSVSQRGVLRGLHFQGLPHTQAKLIEVLRGEIFDVAVDLRLGSPSFGHWYGLHLRGEDGLQLFVPAGFAHGFCALADATLVLYKCSTPYAPAAERTLLWNDPQLGIEWPLQQPLLSPKDARGLRLAELDPAELPRYAPS